MKPVVKRRPRTKSSKQFCEEKLCCPLIDSEAKIFCEDCNSAQCLSCEKGIHSTKLKYDFHIRKQIPVINESALCQGKVLNLVCHNKNFPDLWCEHCKVQLCYTCYDLYHKTEKRKQHINISISHHHKKLQEEKQKEKETIELYDSSELYQDAMSLTDAINPVVPFSSIGDGSMTYCSFPQEAEDNFAYHQTLSYNKSDIVSAMNDTPAPKPKPRNMHQKIVKTNSNVSSDLQRGSLEDSMFDDVSKSFELIDEQEILKVVNADEFCENLGCDRNDTVKVVSIFGNTGDGKSHTLNHTFFGGRNVFSISPCQASCTIGVWCALDTMNKAIVIDTEGLLGSSENENQRTRLLLKILAISDVVIYRTRAERLHNDMFVFLSNASKAYCKHFSQELKNASQKCNQPASSLGPTLVVFQETTHTDILKDCPDKSAAGQLRDMFDLSKNPVDAFCKICYIGLKTTCPPTNFCSLRECIAEQLQDTSVRSARKPEIIFHSLKALNDKFSDDIETPHLNTFPDQYFTCTCKCLACNARCIHSMNHDTETQPHSPGLDQRCQYQSELGNKVFMCKTCLSNKKESIVIPKTSSSSDSSWMGLTKYLWSGYVYECKNCGIIYRSREHWYGNEEEEKVLHVEYRHVWPQGVSALDGTHNAARKVLDSFHYLADTISSVSYGPSKVLGEWTADQINPSYWVPNSDIIKCSGCELLFTCAEQKHHCRACGKGFCTECSSHRRPVPERGWGDTPVRVCDGCLDNKNMDISDIENTENTTLTARKVGEVMSSTFSVVASALDYPMGMIKNSARPAYWVPDDEITECCVCKDKFGPRLTIHHCRACGCGVCAKCSPGKRLVAFRGWDYPVRVCTKCEKKTDRI